MATGAGARSRRVVRAKRDGAPGMDRASRRRYLLIIGILSFAFVGIVLLHVWLRLQVVQVGYVLSTTSKLQGRLEQENRELKLELATLTSPERLEALARKRLGMVPPEKGQVIILP